MPYKFPERYPRTKDSIDITELNRHFTDIAESLSGNVGEHNLQEANYSVDDEALYKIYNYSNAVLMGFGAPTGSPAAHARPQELTTEYNVGTVLMPNSGTWEVISELSVGASDDFRVLHIFAQANYSWTGYTSGTNANSKLTDALSNPVSGRHEFSNSEAWGLYAGGSSGEQAKYQPYETPNFQVAIRVAGTRYCLSGHSNELYKPHMPLKSLKENQPLQSSPTADYHPSRWPGMLNSRKQAVAGPAHTTMTVDLVDVVNIPPGPDTLVQIIAKRTQPLKNKKYNTHDVIAFLTRKIFVVAYNTSKPKSRSIAPIGITPIRKGDPATQTQLNTQHLQKLKAKVNNLQQADFNRLNRYHIGPAFRQSTGVGNPIVVMQDSVAYSSPLVTQNRCPGEHTSTFAAVGTRTGVTGWTPLTTTETGSVEFLVDVPGPAGSAAPTTTDRGYLLLTGHIHIQHIKKTGNAITDGNNIEWHMGCAGLYYKYGSSRFLINNSVVPISKVTIPLPIDTKNALALVTNSINIHVPLMGVIPIQGAFADDIESFGVCVSTINWNNADNVDIEVLNASLCVEYYKTN